MLPLITVDLHGSYVGEALETVESGIRNLPEVGIIVGTSLIEEFERVGGEGQRRDGQPCAGVGRASAALAAAGCGAAGLPAPYAKPAPPCPCPLPLPLQSIPGGVVVRYITGRGLHSAGGAARIKPEVLRLLAERGVPHVEAPGWVEATLAPAAC